MKLPHSDLYTVSFSSVGGTTSELVWRTLSDKVFQTVNYIHSQCVVAFYMFVFLVTKNVVQPARVPSYGGDESMWHLTISLHIPSRETGVGLSERLFVLISCLISMSLFAIFGSYHFFMCSSTLDTPSLVVARKNIPERRRDYAVGADSFTGRLQYSFSFEGLFCKLTPRRGLGKRYWDYEPLGKCALCSEFRDPFSLVPRTRRPRYTPT